MRKNYGVLTLAAWLAAGAFSVASAQTVSLSIRDGRVTLKTDNATIRQILEEWARVGQAKVVNAEKVTGPPQTLTLIDVPEREALDTVLRQAAGYAVVERQAVNANASVFDKILVMGRTTPVSQGTSASASPAPQTYTPDVADEPIMGVENEPPQPTAPVVNPYAGGGPGAAGANGTNANNAYPGMNNGGAGATVNVRPPETRFDYTNPQAYFDQQRRNQAAQGTQNTTTSQPGIAPAPQPQLFNPYPGSNASPIAVQPPQSSQPNVPTATPTAGNTSSQPGIAPPPQQPAGTGGNFNPYNMNPYQMPPNAGSAPPATPVEPDRAKYANPYVPTKPPDQN